MHWLDWRRLRPARNAITALALMLSTAGCETMGRVLARPEILQRPVPPALTAQCPREPAPPAVFLDEEERFAWIERALTTGRQCRSLSDKQGEFLAHPPPT